MPRRRSLTSSLYRAARLSNNARAIRRGPAATAERLARRKTYRASGGFTRAILRVLGMGK